MNKPFIAAAAIVLLALTGCGATSSSTQTGGGTSSQGSAESPSTAEPTSEALPAKPQTIDDVVAAGWLAGDARPEISEGTDGEFSVVTTGPITTDQIGSTRVPIVLRNNTGTPVTSIRVTGAAKDAAGTILASGDSQGVHPTLVPAGGIALGFIYFDSEVPADATIDYTVASSPAEGEPYFRDLTMDQGNNTGTSITGQATNPSEDAINGPYSVTVFCFNAAGEFVDTIGGFASPDADLAGGQSVTFDVNLFDTECSTFLTGASGYGPL